MHNLITDVSGIRVGNAHDAKLAALLRPLIGRIAVAAMREANYMVDRDADKATPDQAADWLAKRIELTR